MKKRRPEVDDDHLEITEAEIDENLKQTFPASDPPSWTLGCTRELEHEPRKPRER